MYSRKKINPLMLFSAGGIILLTMYSFSGIRESMGLQAEVRKISMLKAKPDAPLAVRPRNDSDVVFYCSRKQWLKELDKISSNPADNAEYMHVLDSIQKQKGVIHVRELNSHASDIPGLSAAPVSFKIFDALIQKGRVFIEYTNGTYVSRIKTRKEKTNDGYVIYYDDAATGRELYSIAHTTKNHF